MASSKAMMKAVGLLFLSLGVFPSLVGAALASSSDDEFNSAAVCAIGPCPNLPPWSDLTFVQRQEYADEDDWNETSWEKNRALGEDYDYDDLLWIHICDEDKARLEAKGWNAEKWEKHGEVVDWEYAAPISPCDELPSWVNLTQDQREDYFDEAWNQMIWEKNRGLGKDYVYDDLMWVHVCDKDKVRLQAKGWNAEKWNHNVDVIEWDDLSPEQRAELESLGVTEDTFDSRDWDKDAEPHHWDMHSAGLDFSPRVIKIDIPDVQKFDIEFLKTLDVKIAVVPSSAVEHNEDYAGETSLEKYILKMLSGNTSEYVQLEDSDKYQKYMRLAVGQTVTKSIPEALLRNRIVEYKPALHDLKHDWSMFLGGNNSLTSMHFDTDRFNFLYVVQGRKRVVMIPNKGLADPLYQPKTFYDGSGWSGVDILSDLDKLPKDAVVLELGPGEGVAIPYRAWHAVENLDHTLAFGLRIP